MKVKEILDGLHGKLGGAVFHAKTGDGVIVTIGKLEATGQIGNLQGHYSTQTKISNWPVILDGTGQLVEVPAENLRRTK